MKKLIFILLCFISIQSFSQIKSSEVDKFSNQRRIETNYVTIHSGFSSNLNVGYRSVDTTLFLNLSGVDDLAGVVGPQDALIFLFDDGSSVKVYPTSVQNYELVSSSIGTFKKYANQYHISLSQVQLLSQKNVVSIRRYFNQNYSDIDLKEKKSIHIKEVSLSFLQEYSKFFKIDNK